MPMPEYMRRLRARVGHDLLITPVATAIIIDDQDAVLLQRRGDTGEWSLPGGMIEPGEEPAQTVAREVLEETGLNVIPEVLVGVYGGPDSITQYPNGDQIMALSITFRCRVVGGDLQPDGEETLELRYFPADQLPDTLIARHRIRVKHALTRSEPYFATF
jgi:8-oxo-dGTP diphosphatase